MAGTRNKNTPGDYCLQFNENKNAMDWTFYKNGANGYAYETHLAGNGLIQGHMPWTTLSHNPVDIESFLFGINSNNLINPPPPLHPELKCLGSTNLYKNEKTIMPIPLVIPRDQRPFPLP
jgi:hypothetical protein